MEGSHSVIRRQLGTIMVEEGFLTPEQLEEAIAEQHRSSKPLGQVLVELGLASAGAVANALAEQHGGLLKTEFGVSAGLRPVAPAPAPDPEPDLRSLATPEEMQKRRLVGELDALRDQCAALRRGVALLESELERLRDAV
ncbi:MAG TPA: hypothetical protein VLS46_04705 [Gaiellaceae bacterium]|nr:hypothetical protein [Gaiellaceae bacterium]